MNKKLFSTSKLFPSLNYDKISLKPKRLKRLPKSLVLKPRKFLNPNIFYQNIINKNLYNKDFIVESLTDYNKLRKSLTFETYFDTYSLFKPTFNLKEKRRVLLKKKLLKEKFINKTKSNLRLSKKFIKNIERANNKSKEYLLGTSINSKLSLFKFLNFDHKPYFELMTPGTNLSTKPVLEPLNKLLFYVNKFSSKLKSFKAYILVLKPKRNKFLCLYNGMQGFIPSKHLKLLFLSLKNTMKTSILRLNAFDLINNRLLYRIPLLSVKANVKSVYIKKKKSRNKNTYRIKMFKPSILSLTFLFTRKSIIKKLNKKCLKSQKNI